MIQTPAGPGTTAAPVPGPGPAWPATTPLDAAYCAERAAWALMRAESYEAGSLAAHLLACAQMWHQLAASMAVNAAMNRPADPAGRERR